MSEKYTLTPPKTNSTFFKTKGFHADKWCTFLHWPWTFATDAVVAELPPSRSAVLRFVLYFLCMGSQNANVSPFRKGIPYLLWKVCRKNKMEYSPENSHFTKKTQNTNWLPCWLTYVKIHERDKVPCWCWGIWTFLDTFWALFIST